MLPKHFSKDQRLTGNMDVSSNLHPVVPDHLSGPFRTSTNSDVQSTRLDQVWQTYLALLIRLYYSPASWALLDQLIVSGMRFATTMLVGLFCGPEDLGIYVLAFSAILVVSISHESLIAKPYQILCQGLNRVRYRTYSGSTLAQMLALAAVVSLLALLATLSLLATAVSTKVFFTSLVLTITLPGILLWEFVRRQAFAAMEMRSAAILDGCLALIQLACLLSLGLLGQLTVVRALLVVGISGGVIGVVRLLYRRQDYQFVRRRMGLDAYRNWNFGRWFFAGQIVGLIQSYAVPWLLTLFYGAEKTGILMACQTLVLLSNPILLGLSNWLGPTAVRTYLELGVRGLNRLLWRVSLISNGCMLAFTLLLVWLGEWLLTSTFGTSFAGNGHLVAITGITALGFSMTVSGSSGLSAVLYPRVILYGTISGSVVAVLTLPLLVHFWGLTGAAWSLASGSLTSGSFHLLGYWLVSKTAHLHQDVQPMENQ
jgi:PST family polysaccharide transporter